MNSKPVKERIAERILSNGNVEEINAVNYPVYDYHRLDGQRIEITSIQERPGEYQSGSFAAVGFRTSEIENGQFRIGGSGARYLLKIETYKLPVTLILRMKISDRGNEYPTWERV